MIGKCGLGFSKHWKIPVLLLASASAFAAELDPVLGTNEQAQLRAALACMNMTETDLGFEKDLGKPVVFLQRSRDLLNAPLGLPVLADQALDAVRSADARRIEALARDWLEVPAGTMPTNEPASADVAWPALDPALSNSLTRFLSGARAADGLLSTAFAAVTAEEKRYVAAAHLAGMFNAEDHADVREELPAAGVTPQEIERVILEGQAVDSSPASMKFLGIVGKINQDALLAAGEVFRGAVRELADSCLLFTNWPAAVTSLETPLGPIVIGTTNCDTYTNAALLVLDPGLDDTYTGDVIRANGLLGQPLAAVVELGGNDRYANDRVLGPCAALFGVCVHLDLRGDDLYEARYSGSAAASCGVAWLEDRRGDDKHRARGFAQAAACVGFACLLDGKGDDDFRVGYCGQAYAGVMGAALLENAEGNDHYFAGGVEHDYDRNDDRFLSLSQGFAIGMRPFAGGGIAALVDLEGDDRYEADVFGQGVSYWYSVGMLLDARGNDEYTVYQYGQGAGIHMALGLLADGGGSDVYQGGILTQGCAHDYGVGMLFDQGGGDDTYDADQHAQGRAMNNALAILVDSGGDDGYTARQPDACQGIGNDGDKREYGSLAVLMDLGGDDIYSCRATNGCRMLRPDFGIVYDLEDE
ncbi:MAG: hypothetical protein BWK77_08140 [Verrucomicrobia bacterium A1]|nr:MAG: hypothetical protein BWK77_08140 [Verrucomicrobia bacterium A1]